ncbi:aliphatic sulfonate ABC transporter substrate-binding protein [Hyphomicrobium sp.]|uniref:aliphatic sulfonate ABC transporter substrate-binding protein n=1 Tax=Hyphomicrobium sp. TaxID=82 RepID=UPI000F9FBF42|nr:aliphatic sulfonate ABC transporter substrate-binding protein [Hyphomicrobium sp.]RUO98139.1 MAG: aliphatic sulfonate ABC transporter substrate-binding protein [Hyphomicrobium sp.]
MDRRQLLQGAVVLGIALTTSAGVSSAADQSSTVRIGYQKSSTLIAILRSNGELEKGLAELGIAVKWSEFSSGLPLLEALNVGAVDLSGDVADTVPIFAQAAGAKLTYFASEAPSPAAQALLVQESSPIHSVAELKGKKVAVTKASGSHYLLIAALSKAGLKFSDIEPAYLTPADGRAAFEKGAVDAWVTWDPYVSATLKQTQARVLADGAGIANYRRYYLASTNFASSRPDVLRLVFAKLQKTGEWVRKNPEVAAQLLAPTWGLDSGVVSLANSHRSYEVRPVTLESLAEEQKIADVFFEQGGLPKRVDAESAQIWSPDKQASVR